MRHRTHRRRIWPYFLILGIAVATYFAVTLRREDRHITVGWKSTVEESVLGEILIQRIEHKLGSAVTIQRHPPLSTTQAAHEALVVNEIDLCPEYAGTALTGVLGLPVSTDVAAVREQVKENYRAEYQVEWLGPLGYNAAFAVVARREFAEKNNLKTLSDLAASPARSLLAVDRDFEQRSNGLTLLMRTYKLPLRGAPQILNEAQLHLALEHAQAEVIASTVTDGWVTPETYTLLTDDKQAFPPNEAGILVRSSTLEKFPSLGGALQGLCGRIDSATMRQMNAAVALRKRRPAEVAAEFLKSAGL
jgi:glycine betaine/choline ABC-type transport system substrate-binding protein